MYQPFNDKERNNRRKER